MPENVIACLQEIKTKVENLVRYSSKENASERWRERVKNAMKHFEMFFSTIQGDDLSSLFLFGEKNEKSVRFSGVPKEVPE